MIRKWKLLLVGVSCVMGTAMAQNNPILLFPKGAPGETTTVSYTHLTLPTILRV